AQDMRAVYERFLDPRAEGFKDPDKWEEVPTLGHTGRAYKSEDDLYAAALEQEPDASAERRAELRTEAGKAARHNVAFYDITFNVQKSVTLVHTAFEAKEVAARAAGDEETAAAWAQFRTAVEDAIWAGNNAGLAYLQDRAGYTRTGHHGGAAGRWADAHEWTVASVLPARLPRARSAPAHPQRVPQPGAGPGRQVAHHRLQGALQVRARRRRGRRAHHRGTPHPRTRGAGGDPPGREGPRDRRRRPRGDGPDLDPPPPGDREGRRADRRRSRPATAGRRTGWSANGSPSRPRLRRGGRSRTPGRPATSCSTGSTPASAPTSTAASPASPTPSSPPAARDRRCRCGRRPR
ncbi:MAG: hypothetical protein WKF73_18905, partial [Nocardioidaceae bacterium]